MYSLNQGSKVKDNAIRVVLDYFVPGYPYQEKVKNFELTRLSECLKAE